MGERVKIDRKKLKRLARKDLKTNYFKAVLVSFLFVFIMGGGYQLASQAWFGNEELRDDISTIIGETKEEVKEEEAKIDEEDSEVEKVVKEVSRAEKHEAINGVLAPAFRQISREKSILGHINATFELFVQNKDYGAGTISFATTMVLIFFYVFVKLVLRVGKNRFFLETRRFKKTFVGRILYPYKTRRVIRMTVTLLMQDVLEGLWWLTIVGGPIKHYQYLMIPYILAENPNIKHKEAFRLSKEMMSGRKWEAFKVDLSLLGWKILELGSFGLSGVFYSEGYEEYIWAEFYAEERKRKSEFTDGKLLNDGELFVEKSRDGVYPDEKANVELRNFKINTDYDRSYSLRSYILFFFTFSFVGWIWEVTLHLVQSGHFVNRGTMHGPWLPIYGTGGVMILFVLKKLRKKPAIFFLATMVLSGVLEYVTHWYLQTFKGMEWWDYHGYFLNINGRICLEGLLIFALAGAGITYFLAPILDSFYSKIKPEIAVLICAVLVAGFGVDYLYSSKHPNEGEGITSV